ncbi:Carboxypeptidase, partial [Trichostrongylus colubriformis]
EFQYANIIYLDAPAGVGFSVRLDGLWNYTDTEVAMDNHAAMKEWFKKFPERMKNDFYAAGESYAGTYIPMLSALLVDDESIKFKGMLIGNGCVDDVLNFNSLVDFNYNHGFIDERDHRRPKGTAHDVQAYKRIEDKASQTAKDISYMMYEVDRNAKDRT